MPSKTDTARRAFLQAAALGVSGLSSSLWLRELAAAPKKDSAPAKAVILLWLAGGPSTIDLWDLKPGHENGGPFREIETAAPGMRFSEHLPKLAKCAKDLAIVRSLTSKEGDHARATRFLQTGYLPGAGIEYPPLGSLLSQELKRPNSDLPAFVSIASSQTLLEPGGGFLGSHHAPLAIGPEASAIADLQVPHLKTADGVSQHAQNERLRLLNILERGEEPWRQSPVVDGLRTATARALKLMEPAAQAAFQLEEERADLRDAYGRNVFGQGCLLARRLVERGVTFVEVTLGGWDTHNDNFDRVRLLSGALDGAFATLLNDLRARGLLESTLVICQGEFGRTPKINGAAGRDHWPQSWAATCAGGGVQGGQVIGKTTPDGLAVADAPASVPDLIATVCKAVGVDPKKQNMSNVGRPIRIADPAAKEIAGLL